MTVSERLDLFIQHLGITNQEFETQCKISGGTASRLSSKSYKRTFGRIAAAYPQLNMKWLKDGEGNMLNPTPDINMARYDSPGDNDVYGDIVKPNISPGVDISHDVTTELEYLKVLLKEKNERIQDLKKQLETAEHRIEDKEERIGELKQQIIELKKNQV